MRLIIPIFLATALTLSAQDDRARYNTIPQTDGNGATKQSAAIVKAEYQKALEETRELSKLVNDLKADLEKNGGGYVLSVGTLKNTEQIEKLSKRIHSRLKDVGKAAETTPPALWGH